MEIEEFVDEMIENESLSLISRKRSSHDNAKRIKAGLINMSIELIAFKNIDKQFDMQNFEVRKCTYLKLEGEPMIQAAYVCIACDPEKNDKMCKECLLTCHKDCKTIYKTDSYIGDLEFICYCGKNNKHLVLIKNTNKNTCNLIQFDKKININSSFFCTSCNVYVCSICYYDCHFECKDKKKLDQISSFKCECEDENHSQMYEFTFKINPEEYFSICKIESVWPIHILNSIFSEEQVYRDLSDYVLVNITNKEDNKRIGVKLTSIISSFSNFFGTTFKTFYFHPNILKMFPYEEFTKFIFKERDLYDIFMEDLVLKFRMLSILLIIHIKKDFQILKNFLTSDFFTCSILERLLYRKFVFSQNTYTKLIREKYSLNKNLNTIFSFFDFNKKSMNPKELIFKMLSIMKTQAIYLDFTISFQNDFVYLLEFISFILKKMLFFKFELIQLITQLYEIFSFFLTPLIQDENINIELDLLKELVKIFYIISINYNDLIIKAYLKFSIQKEEVDIMTVLNSIKNDCKYFIHANSTHGNMLFKMIIQLSRVFNYFDSVGRDKIGNFDIFNKAKFIFNECLSIFILADNNYSKQILNLRPQDLRNYYHKISMIEKNHFNSGIQDYLLLSQKNEDNIMDFLSLKVNIEKCLENFFRFENVNHIRFSLKIIENVKVFAKNYQPNFKHKPNSKLNNTVTNLYTLKILKSIKGYFPFLKVENLSIKEIINELILSSLDETLTKFLRFFSHDYIVKSRTFAENTLFNDELVLILAFLKLFCLKRAGLKYFFTGKNFSRLCDKSLFHKYSLQLIEFLSVIFKGLEVFEIDISDHKMIKPMHERLYENLSNLEKTAVNSGNDLIELKNHLIYTIKILDISTKFCEFEYSENIKKKFIKLIIENEGMKFLNPHNFFKCFQLNFELGNKIISTNINKNKLDNNILSSTKNNEEIANLEKDENSKLIFKENFLHRNKATEQTNNIGSQKIVFTDERHTLNKLQIIQENENLIENSGSTEESNKKNIKLYFSFFNLVSKNLFYVFSDDEDQNIIVNLLQSFNENEKFKLLLNNYNISINQRLILLKYLRNLYFLERINKNDYTQRITPMSKMEYKEYFIQKIYRDKLSNKELQFKQMNNLQKVIEIFLNELVKIDEFAKEYQVGPEWINNNSKTYVDMNNYINELLLSIKSIFDYYYLEKNIYGVKLLYKLAYIFLTKSTIIIDIILFCKSKSSNYKIEEVDLEGSDYKYSKANLIQKIIDEMENLEFNIFNTKTLYLNVMHILWEIFRKTGLHYKFSLGKFLETFDIQSEANFYPDSLIETKDYEYFYETSDVIIIQKKEYNIFFDIKKIFDNQFINIKNTNFINVINLTPGEADLVDYRRNIIEYFIINFTGPNVNFKTSTSLSLLTIITKMLFYDLEETHKKLKFLSNPENENVFETFNMFLKEALVINFSLCRNLFATDRHQNITNLTKLLIQFFQLLAEGFNVDFYHKIFNVNNDKLNFENESDSFDLQKSTNSIYISILKNFITAFSLFQIEDSIEIELPYDKLIVLITNINDFLIEYTDENSKYFGIITGYFKITFSKLSNIIFTKITKIKTVSYQSVPQLFWQKKKLLCYSKIRFLQLTISLIKQGHSESDLINQIIKVYNLPQLFQEINNNFYDLINFMIENKKVNSNIFSLDLNKFIGKLIDLYIAEDEMFRESLQLNLCFKIYHLIKILSELYGMINVNNYLEENEKFKKIEIIEDKIPLYSNTTYKIYKFLEMIILKVEIRRFEGETVSGPKSYYEFFIRPSLTFHLSKESKIEFFQTVNRESAFSKINHLMKETDYFIFEMTINSRYHRDFFYRIIQNIEFYYFEILNYILIILINCIVLYEFYRGPNKEKNDYYLKDSDFVKRVPDLLIVSFTQISFIGLVFLIWLKYQFPISYQHEIMNEYNKYIFMEGLVNSSSSHLKMDNKHFVKNKIRDFLNNKKMGIFKLLLDINSDLTNFQKIRIAISTVLLNREIYIKVLTMLFYIIYLITNLPVFLVFPLLFLYNLSSVLNTIYYCVILKWKQLFLILIFTYLTSYLFSWISLIWLQSVYILDQLEMDGEYTTDNHCSSSIQCLMILIEYGIVTSGTGFTLPPVSYKHNTGIYYGKFFFQLSYFVIVILILGNVFLAVIVDTFGELRDKNTEAEHDKNNLCFICQLSRDNSLNKNIDFESHCRIDHFTWNYVYFLTYLHISNPNDFNNLQNYVWEKISRNDITWIPFLKNDN